VAFEVGFVPQGWTRGQPLRVMRAKPSWPGFVSLDHTKLSLKDSISGDAVGVVRFTVEEAANLDAWLEWWSTPVTRHQRTELP